MNHFYQIYEYQHYNNIRWKIFDKDWEATAGASHHESHRDYSFYYGRTLASPFRRTSGCRERSPFPLERLSHKHIQGKTLATHNVSVEFLKHPSFHESPFIYLIPVECRPSGVSSLFLTSLLRTRLIPDGSTPTPQGVRLRPATREQNRCGFLCRFHRSLPPRASAIASSAQTISASYSFNKR